MSEYEADEETKIVFDKIYQAEVATNNLKYYFEICLAKTKTECGTRYKRNFEICLAKTKTECGTRYKGKTRKEQLNFLDGIRKERLDAIDKARMEIQTEIIKGYVKRKMGK